MVAAIQVELARLAHRLWCDRMRRGGWKHGTRYDETAKTHDALVPFEQLGKRDAALTVRQIASSDLERQLEEIVDYPRGPDRPFGLEEMRVGLGVGWAEKVVFDDPARAPLSERGSVESWDTDETGELKVIRVRWADGQVLEHLPVLRDLRRL